MPAGMTGYFGKGTARGVSALKKGRGQKLSVARCFLKAVSWIVRSVLITALVIAVWAGVKIYQEFLPLITGYYNYAEDIAKNSSPADFKTVQTSYVYDADGKQIARLKTDKDVYYVKYQDMPADLINAVVAIEDKRFWEHEGVDLLSTGKAAVLYLKDSKNIVRGGSTITQQLVKNVYLDREKSIERKAKEIFIALKLEERYTKEQILEFYLNNINFANGYYGIGAAAKGYFNKSVGELSLTETAFLCAIPNNPTLYDPINNTKNTARRRNLILKAMWEQGYAGEEVYWKESNTPVHFYKKAAESYNYEVSYAIDCAVRVFMKEQGFNFVYSFNSKKQYNKYLQSYRESYQSAKTELYTGGYKVYTTINRKVQKHLQKSINTTLGHFKEKGKDGVYKMQGAATVVDNSTGDVIAIVGGRTQDFNGIITLNRAYQSYRQPGSTFKPLVVYTPCFELGYTPDTVVDDSYFEGGPVNSDGNYSGNIRLRKAVEKSKNVVAWKLMQEAGVASCLSYARGMCFSKIVPTDFNLASSLGGLTYGVTTVEMAGGYAALANDGVFRELTCIKKIEYNSGGMLPLAREERRVYSVDAARTMTDVLQGVAKRGTAKGLVVDGMPVACKTGTTNGQTTGWFCGYTPYYTVCAYVGYDMNKRVSSLWGSTYPLQVWRDIQVYLNKGLEFREFPKPEKRKTEKDKEDEKSPARSDNTSMPVEPTPGSVVTPVPTEPSETLAEELVVTPVPEPAEEQPTEQPAEEPVAEKPVEESAEPTEEPAKKPVLTPVPELAEPTEEPAAGGEELPEEVGSNEISY